MFSAEAYTRNLARTEREPPKRVNNVSREQQQPAQPRIKRINSINWNRDPDAKPRAIEGPNGVVTLPDRLPAGSGDQPLNPQPLIADIIRTKDCIPGSIFLVEKIEHVRIYLEEEEEEADDDEDEEPEPEPVRVIRTINNLGGRARRAECERKREKKKEKREVEYRAMRLLLGDGEICIQALLTPAIYPFVDGGSVYEGCYVRCERFELVVLDGDVGDEEDDGVGDPAAAAAKRQKRGKMFYLLVRDIVTVGWNEIYLGILRREKGMKDGSEGEGGGGAKSGGKAGVVGAGDGKPTAPKAAVAAGGNKSAAPKAAVGAGGNKSVALKTAAGVGGDRVKASVLRESGTGTVGTMTGQFEGMTMPPQIIKQPVPVKDPLMKTTTAPPPAVKDNFDDIEYISDSDDEAFEKLQISIDRAAERRVEAESNGPLQELQAAVLQQNQKQAKALPLVITDPHQPLKLTPLRSIPNLPHKQNWMVNVLAVVASLSAVEPAHLPPYSQRTARLADPSTSKRVLLNVFLDPEGFTPAVGSVVMLVGVKNHRFDGGCLKKYASDRPRDGTKSWWLENPKDLEWCEGEVVKLRNWWDELQEDRMQIG